MEIVKKENEDDDKIMKLERTDEHYSKSRKDQNKKSKMFK